MATYREMLEMIGKFKQVPEILANPDLAYAGENTMYNHGGRHPKYFSGGGFGTGQGVTQGFTSGGPSGGTGYVSPYSQNMGEGSAQYGAEGGLVTDEYGNLVGGPSSGPGYQGLTPYEGGSVMAHSLINPRVSSFNEGGEFTGAGTYGDTTEVPVFPDAPGMNEEGYQVGNTAASDAVSTDPTQINPHVSDDSYKSFSAQLKIGENAGNKGYDKEKDLWFPFSVGINNEQNIGWGINMSTFSEEEKLRLSKGITTEELEGMFNERVSKHLDKSKDKITNMGGDWETLPDNVKLALTDFSYNLGGLDKFPKFTQAIIDNDLETAQKEYKRYYTDKGVKKEMTARNEDIVKMLFQNAKGDGKIYKKGGTYVTTTQDKNQKSTPSESQLKNPYTSPEFELQNTSSKSFSKGGKFSTGGTVKKNSTDDDEIIKNYSKSAGSQNRGAFPRMKNEGIINGNVNESTFLAIAMAQYYGYTGEINMTSGQRGGKDQTRVYGIYQREDAGVYRRFPEYQQAIADSLGVSLHDYKRNNVSDEEWDNQDTDEVSGWINDIWAKVQSGEISMEEAGKLYPMHHMEGAAGDFTGGFKTWLKEGKSGKNKEAAKFLEDFNVTVLDESDHFHVTFGQDVNIESLPEERHADYLTHKNQFAQLSVESSDVAGTTVINMNPSVYQGEQRGILTNDLQKLPLQSVSAVSSTKQLDTEIMESSPNFDAYMQYRHDMHSKEMKSPAYRIAETFEGMERYKRPDKFTPLSYEDWAKENGINIESEDNVTSPTSNETISEDQPIDNILNPPGLIEGNFTGGNNPYGLDTSPIDSPQSPVDAAAYNPDPGFLIPPSNNPNPDPGFIIPPGNNPNPDPGFLVPSNPYNPDPGFDMSGNPQQPLNKLEPEWFNIFNIGVDKKVKDINNMINPYGR